jgi:hypothetical protein
MYKFSKFAHLSNFFAFTLFFAILTASLTRVAQAQYFPTFGASYGSKVPGYGPANVPQGVSVTSVPAYSQSTELLAAFNIQGSPGMANSLDGINWSSSSHIPAQEYCDATPHTDRCSPSIVNFNGTPYVAFWDTSNNLGRLCTSSATLA